MDRMSTGRGATSGARPMKTTRLGVGFIGSGFNARFHISGWTGVRDGDVRGIWSPDRKGAASAASLARSLGTSDGGSPAAPKNSFKRSRSLLTECSSALAASQSLSALRPGAVTE